MTRVNLLPPELRERAQTRRQTVLVGILGGVILTVIVFAYVLQGFTESRINRDLATQNATNAGLQQQVNELQHFATLRTQLQTEATLLSQALAGTVSWSGVLHDLSLVIPDRMWITSLTASITPPVAVAPTVPTTPGQTLIGSLSFAGTALDSDTVALWLTRVEQVKGWVNAWVSNATASAVGTTPAFTFSSTVDLTAKAAVPGGQL
jgi:Tfp pilus assembly protein PilN